MLKAVVLDFDGVIADSEMLHFRCFNEVLAGFSVKIATKDYYKDYLGLTDVDVFGLVVDKGLLKLTDQQIENLAEQKNEIFKKLAKTEAGIIPGVRNFLQMLEQNNIPIAICSGALLAEIELILEAAQLRCFFEVIVSAEQVKRGKPQPDGPLLTLQKLNEKNRNSITAGQCVMVEDSYWGLEAAKAAGMHTIAVTNSYDPEQLTMAEKIVTQLDELSMDDLQKLCG